MLKNVYDNNEILVLEIILNYLVECFRWFKIKVICLKKENI